MHHLLDAAANIDASVKIIASVEIIASHSRVSHARTCSMLELGEVRALRERI